MRTEPFAGADILPSPTPPLPRSYSENPQGLSRLKLFTGRARGSCWRRGEFQVCPGPHRSLPAPRAAVDPATFSIGFWWGWGLRWEMDTRRQRCHRRRPASDPGAPCAGRHGQKRRALNPDARKPLPRDSASLEAGSAPGYLKCAWEGWSGRVAGPHWVSFSS